MSGHQKEVERRRFLSDLGGWALRTLVGGVALSHAAARADDPRFRTPGFTRKPLPGGCITPAGPVEQGLAAILDTVVPGPETDPSGDPGALEACAMNLMVDSAYPFRQYASTFVGIVDSLAHDGAGGPTVFADLSHEARLAVLVEAQEVLPILRLAFRAIRSAFYGGAYNGVGLDLLGYPGPNLGYRHIREASFRVPVCTELTATGSLP